MDLTHAHIVHHEIDGPVLTVYVDLDPDPTAPGYNRETMFEILELARRFMHEHSLTEEMFQHATKQ